MRTLITIALITLTAACSTESPYERIIRERDERIAAIPAEVDRDFAARYGPDRSKWPKAPDLPSSCESYDVAVYSGGHSSSGSVLIC